MKQKRENERLSREVDSLCLRLNAVSDDDDHALQQGGQSLRFLRQIDWSSLQPKPSLCSTSAEPFTVHNLECEASDDDNDADVAATTRNGAQRRDSLKVKIKVSRNESSYVDLSEKTCDTSLPLKKRFKQSCEMSMV